MNCFGPRVWQDALSDANNLADGACDLTDGSAAGDWRLPNPLELTSLVDFSKGAQMLTTGHPFTNYALNGHWTSTSYMTSTNHAYWGGPATHGVYVYLPKSHETAGFSWPVRGGFVIDEPEEVFADGFE